MADGGPAYPALFDSSGVWGMHKGMSLRDWFAGQALAGMRASKLWSNDPSRDIARAAYSDADAMLKAREQSNG